MYYNTLIFNVDELWLKGGNRHLFFKMLRKHINWRLKSLHEADFRLWSDNHRFLVESSLPFNQESLLKLKLIPGLNAVELVRKVDLDYPAVIGAIKDELNSYEVLPTTFKIQTKRSNKSFSMGSLEMNCELGHEVLQMFPSIRVDVHRPEVKVFVKILDSGIYISTKKLPGIGGLPTGSSGKLVTLMSGGLDSPVASFLMSKRGCSQDFIFFYAYPFVGEEVKAKVIELVKIVQEYQRKSRLFIVPFGNIQQQIAENCSPEYRTLLFRKYMLDCASILAKRVGAQALLTGDSLGQVSSQTMSNISLCDSYSSLSVFRPLIGFNKSEIISLAQEIGTYETSILPHDDACAMFAAKHPITKPNLTYFNNFIEKYNDLVDLEKALDEASMFP